MPRVLDMDNTRPTTPDRPNVTTKLLSPFRYPGGKTWLVPRIFDWLASKPKPKKFIEPFAGGGIVSLNVVYRQMADHAILVEIDEQVAAVWNVIIYGNGKALADRVGSFDMTRGSVESILSDSPSDLEELAFQTIIRNRVNHSGILASGAGMLKHGEDGRGVKSRWYPETLKKRILEICKMRSRITFIDENAFDVLPRYIDCSDAVFFIDPPYTAGSKSPGRRLYDYHEVNHEKLFKLVDELNGDFLMSYSNDETVYKLASRYNFDTREISMRSNHHEDKTELLIGRDLSWVD